MAAGFVGVQWLVISQIDNVTLLLVVVVLALPHLVAHVLPHVDGYRDRRDPSAE